MPLAPTLATLASLGPTNSYGDEPIPPAAAPACPMENHLGDLAGSAWVFGVTSWEVGPCPTSLLREVGLPPDLAGPRATFRIDVDAGRDGGAVWLLIDGARRPRRSFKRLKSAEDLPRMHRPDSVPLPTERTYEPPSTWPVNPDSGGGWFTTPSWWALTPGEPGEFHGAQHPALFADCMTHNAQGMLVFRRGRDLYYHSWSQQYLGGCGA
jgi:hypothetical protein